MPAIPASFPTCAARSAAVPASALTWTAISWPLQVTDRPGRPDSSIIAAAARIAAGIDGAAGLRLVAPVEANEIFLELPAGADPLAAGPGGQVVPVPGGKLPRGWRWVTDLDDAPGAQQEVA